MLSIIANPSQVIDNLRKLQNPVFVTKTVNSGGRGSDSVDQNGAFTFGNVLETVGSTDINEYFSILTAPDVYRTASFGGADYYITTYNNRTASMRIACPIPARTGSTLTGFFLERPGSATHGSGVTATATVTLKKMDTSGALTTVCSGTATLPTAYPALKGSTGSPVTINAGDRIIIEISLAPASGTHNTTNYCTLQFVISVSQALFHIW